MRICTELLTRNFENIDSAIYNIGRFQYNNSMKLANPVLRLHPEFIAKSIVYMAQLLGIYWDDTTKSDSEVKEFRDTLLGETVFSYGQYTSATL